MIEFNVNLHPTKIVNLNGKLVSIDEKIADLIWEMNKAGLKTDYSCQGGKGIDRFISIDLDSIDYTIVKDGNKRSLVIRWKGD